MARQCSLDSVYLNPPQMNVKISQLGDFRRRRVVVTCQPLRFTCMEHEHSCHYVWVFTNRSSEEESWACDFTSSSLGTQANFEEETNKAAAIFSLNNHKKIYKTLDYYIIAVEILN